MGLFGSSFLDLSIIQLFFTSTLMPVLDMLDLFLCLNSKFVLLLSIDQNAMLCSILLQ